MTTRITFNKTNIESIETPLTRSRVYSNEVKGLQLETFKSGTKVFRLIYKFNNFQYVYTIGQYPTIQPKYALEKARELKQLVHEGVNKEKAEREKQLQVEKVKKEKEERIRLDKEKQLEQERVNKEKEDKDRKKKEIANREKKTNFRFRKFK